MRIVAHNGAPVYGGAERATIRLLRGLAGRGHEVLLLCNDPAVRDGAESAGVPAALQHLGGDLMVSHSLRLARRLRAETPDTLLLTTFRKLWLGAMAGRWAGVPRVVARVGLETDTPRSAKYRFVLNRWIDAVVLNAESMRAGFEGLGADGPAISVIQTGMRPPAGPQVPGAVRAALNVPDHAHIIGTVARLAEQKRLDRLLRVAARLPSSTHVVVAGHGPERAALRALATELGIADRTHWLGHREDVGAVLDALDVFVVTSDREGLSNAMLEALWAGVPVVSTPVSGALEALEAGSGSPTPGLVVGFAEDELASALEGLLEDATARSRMGAAARSRAEERFSEGRMLAEWERILGGDP